MELGVLFVMVDGAYLSIIPYSQNSFLLNFVFNSKKAYLARQCKKVLHNPCSYRSTIDENPIPLQQICVLSYLCSLKYCLIMKHCSSRFNTILKTDVYQMFQSNWVWAHIIVQVVMGCVKIKRMNLTNIQREVTVKPHIWPSWKANIVQIYK